MVKSWTRLQISALVEACRVMHTRNPTFNFSKVSANDEIFWECFASVIEWPSPTESKSHAACCIKLQAFARSWKNGDSIAQYIVDKITDAGLFSSPYVRKRSSNVPSGESNIVESAEDELARYRAGRRRHYSDDSDDSDTENNHTATQSSQHNNGNNEDEETIPVHHPSPPAQKKKTTLPLSLDVVVIERDIASARIKQQQTESKMEDAHVKFGRAQERLKRCRAANEIASARLANLQALIHLFRNTYGSPADEEEEEQLPPSSTAPNDILQVVPYSDD